MNKGQLQTFKTWFGRYVAGFYTADPGVDPAYRLKEMHTHRVCENLRRIGTAIGLSESDLDLAEIAALFHDIGRFKQFQIHQTFNDKKSVNHARTGIQQLAMHKILNSLTLAERRCVLVPIAWHNAFQIPQMKDDRLMLFTRLLRDADKLDIWKVVAAAYQDPENQDNGPVFLDLPDTGTCSQSILRALHDGRLAWNSHVACVNDLKLLQISWAYDLNFSESYRLLQQSGIIEALAALVPDTAQIRIAVGKVIEHVEKNVSKETRPVDFY